VLIRDVTDQAPGPGAVVQGRDHPGDPPPAKNNLQTVAALLRLQARRTNNAEGREAAGIGAAGLVDRPSTMRCRCRWTKSKPDEVIDRILRS
jgi:hypothetical protein